MGSGGLAEPEALARVERGQVEFQVPAPRRAERRPCVPARTKELEGRFAAVRQCPAPLDGGRL